MCVCVCLDVRHLEGSVLNLLVYNGSLGQLDNNLFFRTGVRVGHVVTCDSMSGTNYFVFFLVLGLLKRVYRVASYQVGLV